MGALILAVVVGTASYVALRRGLRLGAPVFGNPWHYSISHMFRGLVLGGLLTKSSGGYFQNQGSAETSVHAEPVMRLPLAKDLEAQIPVSLPMSATKVGPAQQARLDQLAASLETVAAPAEVVTRAQAHADGIALWNVTRHDGTILHREGIKPDGVAVPTPEGIRAGKDEVLERGLGVLEGAPRR